ncbi:ATPase of the AAA+ family [Spraguea lophii 42_110]|uniref:ATPase of the AAA+ family n=1 Tax=Spraguea lophii (strain 42_110) TaxID=1358809 RepID=S7XL84_SPRLO|nr:ATPase of the AAA+ family [Spraguea lophii 42_110]
MRDYEKKKNDVTPEEEKMYYFVNKSSMRMEKDITVDLITYLVRNNLYNGRKRMNWKKISLIIVILAIIIGMVFYFNSDINSKENFKSVDDVSVYANTGFFGKENVFDLFVARISRMIGLINLNDKKLLSFKLTPTKKNFLLYGLPGTGKTLFVKKMAYLLDQNLRLEKYMQQNKIVNLSSVDIMKKIYSISPKVRLICIQPSSLNDKYVGQTEKNIRELFENAKTGNYEVTIIFIDEIDSFFGERTKEGTEHSANVKSEFLCTLDGARTALSDKVFVIGATNFVDKIDAAFLRRFSTKIKFNLPDKDERKLLIENFLAYNTALISKREINKLASISENLTQSQISRIFSDATDLSDSMTYSATFCQLEKAFNKAKYKGDFKEKELADENTDINETEKKYLFCQKLNL